MEGSWKIFELATCDLCCKKNNNIYQNMGCVNVLMKGDAHPTKMDKYHMMLIIDVFF